jgi:hypothetical protein
LQSGLRNEFIFLFGEGVLPRKKNARNCIIAATHDAKFLSFLGSDSYNKTNKFISYHLIISKHKYYVRKLYMSALYS